MTFSPQNRHSSAFTLIELLVVIAIISVLMALIMPSLSQARETARVIQCSSNIRQLAIGFHFYASDFKNYPPVIRPTGNTYQWTLQLAPYLGADPGLLSIDPASPVWVPKAIKVMQCPSTFGKTTIWDDCSYGPNSFFTQTRENDQYQSIAPAWWQTLSLDGPTRLDDRRLASRQSQFILLGESVTSVAIVPSWNASRLYDYLHMKQRVYAFLDGHAEHSGPQVLYVIGMNNAGDFVFDRNNAAGSGEP